MRKRTAPANDSVVAVPVFTPDPHGAAIFAGVTAQTGGGLGGTRPVIDANHAPWHGWTAAPQRTTGAANIGGGRPKVPPGTRLDQERGGSDDPIRSIFESRMTDRRFS